jgi:hypothetical protein
MENAGVQKEQTAGTSSIAGPVWDPFWFMRAMLGWGRPADAASFDVEETDDSYVCTVNAKLTLPDEADAAHVKAELKNGELRLLVPKATKARRAPEKAGRGSARGEQRRGERKRAGRG